MLVLSRKCNQKIVIGGNIVITILHIPDLNKVRIGIEAPPEIVVDRLEVHRDKQAEAADQVWRAELAEAIRREKLAAADGRAGS